MAHKEPAPQVLRHPPKLLRLEGRGKGTAPWRYPVFGFLLGAVLGVLLGHPLAMVVFNFQAYVHGKAALDPWKFVLLSFAPHMWPMMTLFAVSTGVFGAILGQVFKKLHDHQLQIKTLHQEFELQVASLRHHYKNLTIGILGFSGRISRKVAVLAQKVRQGHGEECPQAECCCQELPGLEKDVEILAETSQRLGETLGKELAFLKALTGNRMATETHDLFPVLIGAIRNLLESRFQDKNIQVEINGQPFDQSRDTLWFPFEPLTMEVILENLLSNAMKYSDHIEVDIHQENGLVQIAIIDHGSGFEVEKLRQLLLTPREGRELGSTQLGLRVTLHLLEKCGGRLLVAGQPGIGSNFTLEFPQ